MRYMNAYGTQGSYIANPHRRRRHRNPDIQDLLDGDYWFKQNGFMDAVGVGAGFVVTEKFASGVNLGQISTTAAGMGNLGRAVIDGGARALLAVLGGALFGMVGQRHFGRQYAIGGVAAGALKAVGDLGVLPADWLQSGSLIVGHRVGNPIPVANGQTPLDVRSNTPIPPVYSL